MRRLVTLVLLLGGMQLLLPLGSRGSGSEALLSFGFLILGAHMVGEYAAAIALPKIVGYIAAGVVFGPHVLGTVSAEGVTRLTLVSELAVAVIAFLAGAELRWSEVRERGMVLVKIMSAELALGFVALTLLLYSLHGYIPTLAGLPRAQVLAFSALFASVGIVHSPAVTMALLSETGARGPVARTTLGVVLLSDVVVVVLFTAVLSVTRSIAPPLGADAGLTIGEVAWQVLGATLIGAVLGVAVALYLRFVGRELILFAVLVAFFGLEVARLAHVEMLLTLLTMGFVTENLSDKGEELRAATERSAAPIFVVFFALSGASIDLELVTPLLPLVVPIALVRALAIRQGVRIGSAWARVRGPERRLVWLGLVSQVGVAIGLASILADAYPDRGAGLSALLLTLIALNQTIGPVLFRKALIEAGELEPGPDARRAEVESA
ncbi:MAG TPA: cation:proton antiporter [Longimicrobiales bacterium]|nr:cation:proton antiporter [Longimicrobiales bacterium]